MSFRVLRLFACFSAAWLAACTPMPIYMSTNRSGTTKTGEGHTGAATGASTGVYRSGIPEKQRNAVMTEIREWMGTPYRFGVVEKGKGTDCSGFVGFVFRKVLEVELPREAADMYERGEHVTEAELRFGDLVFFQNTYKGAHGASHVGIYVGDGQFAHASTTVGVTLSRLSEEYYRSHFLGCKRVL